MGNIGRITLLVYGVFLLIGGIMGYAMAKSPWSLVSGILSLIVLAGLYWGVAPSQPKTALGVGCLIAVGWALFFSWRIVSKHEASAGGPGLLSVIAIIIFALALANKG